MLRIVILLASVLLAGWMQAEEKRDPAAARRSPPLPAGSEARKAAIPGLKLWLKFDADSGAKAVNSAPHGADAEVVGAAWTKEGKHGGAMRFNGQHDRLITGSSIKSGLRVPSVTLALWIFPEAGGVVVSELDQPRLNAYWHDSQIEVLDDGEVRVRVWRLPGVSLGKAALRQWHHVVLRFDAREHTLDGFLDGIRAPEPVRGDRDWNGDGELYYVFGPAESTHMGHGGGYHGLMDDIRLYDRPLTDDEVRLLADLPPPSADPNAGYEF